MVYDYLSLDFLEWDDVFFVEVFVFLSAFYAFVKWPVKSLCLGVVGVVLVSQLMIPPQAFVDLYDPWFHWDVGGVRDEDLQWEVATGGKLTQLAVVYSRTTLTNDTVWMKMQRSFIPGLHENEVLVQVHAAAINPVDYQLGTLPFVPYAKPIVGFDIAGVVVASRSSKFAIGDEVYGESEWGALTSLVSVRDVLLHTKPKELSFDAAASVVMAFKTSYEALVERAHVGKDSRVLVLGGSGGCGMYGVQIAKWKGAYVAATCSKRNVNFVRSLGADKVVDYTKNPDPSAVLAADFDVIYDTVGDYHSVDHARRLLKPGGVFVTIAQTIPFWTKLSLPYKSFRFTMRFNGDNLAAASEMAAAGALQTHIQEAFELAEFASAFKLLQSRRVVGKLVLHPPIHNSPTCGTTADGGSAQGCADSTDEK